MKDIGKILKNARENKEYTQKQVMELTGIHRKSLSGYENNVAEPDLSTFATLANLYGISADEALEIGEPDPSVSLLRFEFQVLSLFKELNEKEGVSILMVTHDSKIASYSSKLLYIKDGIIDRTIERKGLSQKEYFYKIVDINSSESQELFE